MNTENNDLFFRGKTNRRRKRDTKRQREKELLALDRKRMALWKEQQSLGYEELEEPYQKGYKRYFVLREDIARSKHADFYEELLPFINNIQYSLREDFKRRKRRKNRVRQYAIAEQRLETLCHYKFNKVPKKFSSLFQQRIKIKNGYIYKSYQFTEPWRYKLFVEPNIITHKRIIEAALESEIDKLDNHIEGLNLQGKISKAQSKRSYYNYWRSDYLKPQETQPPIYKIKQALYEEQLDQRIIKMDSNRCPFSIYDNRTLKHLCLLFLRSTKNRRANPLYFFLTLFFMESPLFSRFNIKYPTL